MYDDLDLRLIDRHHDADPHYREALRQRVAAILDDSGAAPTGEASPEETMIDLDTLRPVSLQRQHHRWVARAAALMSAAAIVVALLVVAWRDDQVAPAVQSPQATTAFVDETVPASDPAVTIDTAAPLPPPEPFVGVWVSTDTDGSSQTMEIVPSDTGEYEVVVRDDVATAACAGAASTMTGTGLLATDERLVIAQPELTCDGGATPSIGLPPQTDIADFTFDRDPVTDALTDIFGVVWQREGSNVDLGGPATSSPPSDQMWPQSTLEEVRAAQKLADAGDPDHTWQVEPQLTLYEEMTIEELGHVELVDRFLREVLGWEAYLFVPYEGGAPDGRTDGALLDQRYLRCAPGRTNPLYTPGPEPEMGELCAPTIDDLNYESVSIDLVQLDRQGSDGIWVVNRWELRASFAQADPVAVEAQGRERLEEFLAARIAGEGAEGLVALGQYVVNVPLLYSTTLGAPYERYEIERVDGPQWPFASMTFGVRLFADGNSAVVEQQIVWYGELRMDLNTTTENGQPVVVSYTSTAGEVTVAAPGPWKTWSGGGTNHPMAPEVWFWELERGEIGDEDRVEFTDPVAYDSWCAANGGSPLLSAPADAAAIAQALIASPDFETTTPVAARIGGLDAVSIDVTLAPGGKACGVGMILISRWIHTIGWDPGLRLRLYLVDLPEGMPVETLAITVVAPEERFDDVIAETSPIIESIEFHPG